MRLKAFLKRLTKVLRNIQENATIIQYNSDAKLDNI